jgi:2-dehydropantoate 2-reductase
VKIGVMGAGAVGCYVGGRLAKAGADVVLIGRDRIKREIDEHGLHLGDLDGAIATVPRVRLETDVAGLADRDVVLCCVKSGATADAAERLAAVLRPEAIVVSLQNGVRNPDELRRRLKQTVLAGIVNFNILAKGKGVFRRATSGPLILESSSNAHAVELCAALRAAGFDVEQPADIRGVQWSKLVINLNNAISALSDRPTKELVLSAGYRRVLSGVMGEALRVLRAAGIRPAKMGNVPVTILPLALRLPTLLVRMVARAQLKIDPEARSSMWEDLTGGRPTEVDYINGEVVALAEACGAPAPLNRRIVAIVHEAEREGAGSPKLSAEALWLALSAPSEPSRAAGAGVR